MKTDDTDLAIIRHLWNGRTPFSKIAKELGITTNTVRARVNKLVDNGVLQIIGLVDPDAVPSHSSAIMAFKIKPKVSQKAVKQIGELNGVVMAGCVSGRFDIMALVFFNAQYTHRDFVFNELAKVEGIVSVETFFKMDAVNWQMRYVL
jgi:Lrp/AsnC family transcriptional regulator for asnA, asnC and gidA